MIRGLAAGQSALDATAAFNYGVDALKLKREEEALPLVQAAAKANPNDARLWQVVGLLKRALDDLGPAIRALEKAAALAPKDPKIAHALARAHLEAGTPRPELFDQAAALAPTDLSIILAKAAALLMNKEGAEAIQLLLANLRRQPMWTDGHALVARIHNVMGQPERLTESVQQALVAYPGEAVLWDQLVSLLASAGRHEDALKVIGRATQFIGNQPFLSARAAASLDELGDHAAAARLYAGLQPIADVTCAMNYARHLLRTGAYRAAADFAEPWTQTPQAHNFWPLLSLAWRLNGDPRWEWLEGDSRLIGVYDIGDKLGPIDGLAKTLRHLHVAVSQPLDQSLRGGTQTDGHLLARLEPEIRELRTALVDTVRQHIGQLPPPDPTHPTLSPARDRPVRFSGSWSVRLSDAGHHAHHVHPGGWFSSAFYVAMPQGDNLGPPPAGWLVFGQPPAELNIALEPIRSVEPKPGRLVLFPSTMWHGTVPFRAGERLTVAFDVARPPA